MFYAFLILAHFIPEMDVSDQEYGPGCIQELEFKQRIPVVCHQYTIKQDDECEVEEQPTHFVLLLGLTSTDRLRLDPSSSSLRITIDDSREPECCKMFVAI